MHYCLAAHDIITTGVCGSNMSSRTVHDIAEVCDQAQQGAGRAACLFSIILGPQNLGFCSGVPFNCPGNVQAGSGCFDLCCELAQLI